MRRLINDSDGSEIRTGDECETFRGEKVTVVHMSPPHKPSSEGKVVVKFVDQDWQQELYPSVIGATYEKGE